MRASALSLRRYVSFAVPRGSFYDVYSLISCADAYSWRRRACLHSPYARAHAHSGARAHTYRRVKMRVRTQKHAHSRVHTVCMTDTNAYIHRSFLILRST
jgi:hypothetical protein